MSLSTVLLLSSLVVLIKGNADTQDLEIPQVTRLLTIENLLRTEVTTMSYTKIVYPTCTATVPGIVSCAHQEHIKPSGAFESSSVTIPADFSSDGISHSYHVAEVVMPSCDCLDNPKGRMPRLLNQNLITIKATTVLTTYTTITYTDSSTTVSITYNGCVPSDAPTTTLCNA
ncbi:hypothetical protein SK128_010749 [Halocaridina rubra]|uniref:Uncharacterized protein n=1 Tax=Halocaridina rubra TaxID=373956 RepID=A0AAN9AGY5_HALRR